MPPLQILPPNVLSKIYSGLPDRATASLSMASKSLRHTANVRKILSRLSTPRKATAVPAATAHMRRVTYGGDGADVQAVVLQLHNSMGHVMRAGLVIDLEYAPGAERIYQVHSVNVEEFFRSFNEGRGVVRQIGNQVAVTSDDIKQAMSRTGQMYANITDDLLALLPTVEAAEKVAEGLAERAARKVALARAAVLQAPSRGRTRPMHMAYATSAASITGLTATRPPKNA